MKITSNTKEIEVGDIFFCFLSAEKYLSIKDIEKSEKVFAEKGFLKRNSILFEDNGKLKSKVVECQDLRREFVKQLKLNCRIPEKLIAITGTKGKTSSCWFLFQILANFKIKVGYIGTLGVYYNTEGEVHKINKEETITTPSIDDLYNYMNTMYNYGAKCIVFESSSHSLLQARLEGLKVDVGVFTNLSQDHLDYHKNMDDYFEAKTLLFKIYVKRNGYAILNTDNISTLKLWRLEEICSNNKIKTCLLGTKGKTDCSILSVKQNGSEQFVNFFYKDREYIFHTSIIGKFQIYNLIDAVLCCHLCFNIRIEDIIGVVKNVNAPLGRMQKVEKYDIFVDYSHTPKSLEEALNMLKNIYKKVIVVFGCGGDRDRQKRPIMFEIAKKISNVCIITEDNLRNEKIENIIKDMLCFENNELDNNLTKDDFVIKQIHSIRAKYGNKNNCEIKIIKNRGEAIQEAIKIYLQSVECDNDIALLIAGKGHENYKIVGKDKIVTDCDYDVCAKYLNLS